MSKIVIKKSPMADTRSCDVSTVSKDQLLSSSIMHIADVRNGVFFLTQAMLAQAATHDVTKLTDIDQFYSDFQTGFKEHTWWDKHKLVERHHLADGAGDDVNLIDVMEYLTDSVVAGKARTGKLFPIQINSDILMRAFHNTVQMVTDAVEVME